MGMFDYIRCFYPLPDGYDASETEFQTKDLENLMERYTITAEGQLVAHRVRYDEVPEHERPYYGTPEWDTRPMVQVLGMLRAVPVGDEVIEHHGDITFYTSNVCASGPEGYATVNNEPLDSREYTVRFTNGKVQWIQGGSDARSYPGPHLPKEELQRLWGLRSGKPSATEPPAAEQ